MVVSRKEIMKNFDKIMYRSEKMGEGYIVPFARYVQDELQTVPGWRRSFNFSYLVNKDCDESQVVFFLVVKKDYCIERLDKLMLKELSMSKRME